MKNIALTILMLVLLLGHLTPVSAQDTLRVLPQDSLKTVVDSANELNTEKSILNSVDTTEFISSTDTAKVKLPIERQFRMMADISHPIGSVFLKNQYGYEFVFDYNINKEVFLVAELGYGGCEVDFESLKYTSQNAFVRVGVDRSMFSPMYKGDWDMVTVGARYGIGFGNRSPAAFTVPNPFGGLAIGEAPQKSFLAHWFELTMGLRFEVLPRIYMGWNARIRINFSPNAFGGAVSPSYLAGLGKPGAVTSFGFNYYIGYALRWHK